MPPLSQQSALGSSSWEWPQHPALVGNWSQLQGDDFQGLNTLLGSQFPRWAKAGVRLVRAQVRCPAPSGHPENTCRTNPGVPSPSRESSHLPGVVTQTAMNTQPAQRWGCRRGCKQLTGAEEAVSVQGHIATIQGGACPSSSSGGPGFWAMMSPQCLGTGFRSASSHRGLLRASLRKTLQPPVC